MLYTPFSRWNIFYLLVNCTLKKMYYSNVLKKMKLFITSTKGSIPGCLILYTVIEHCGSHDAYRSAQSCGAGVC